MATDHIRYDILAQAALRGVVRTVLVDVAKKGLPGDHHFKITFNTSAPGVRLSDRMRAQYPETMTIILQHQFWDLHVDDDGFEVGLSFGGIPERLAVPFEAVTAFFDPAVQFGFQFEMLDAVGAGGEAAPIAGPGASPAAEKPAEKSAAKPTLASVEGKTDPGKAEAGKAEPGKAEPGKAGTTKTDAGKAAAPGASSVAKPADEPPDRPAGGAGAEVVRLDRFRKK